MSSSEEDEGAFENFISSLKTRNTVRPPTANKSGASSEEDLFEDAQENLPPADSPKYRSANVKYYDGSDDERPAPLHRFSDPDSDDESAFEIFVSSLKNDRVGVNPLRKSKSAAAMDSFIVDDDDMDELEETWTSCSESDRSNSEEGGSVSSSAPEEYKDPRSLFVRFQLQDEEKLERKIFRCEKTPPKSILKESKTPKNVKDAISLPPKPKSERKPEALKVKSEKQSKLEKPVEEPKRDDDAQFLYDLSAKETAHLGMTDEAKKLRRKFVKTRLEIANRVAEITNRRCFESQLQMQHVIIEFTKRLLKTAGDTTTKGGALGLRTCRIRLAEKVCDTPGRTRDTLIHELCHAAVSMIDGVLHHKHGPLWVRWTRVVGVCFPKLPPVTVCHRYTIQTKFVYVCLSCGHNYGRHSKSINVETHRCGVCRGVLQLSSSGCATEEIRRDANADFQTPASKSERRPNAWTSFVSANFGSVKREMPPRSAHKDVMARLKVMYQSERAPRTTSAQENADRPPPMTPLVSLPRRPSSSEIDEQIDLILSSSLNVKLNIS